MRYLPTNRFIYLLLAATIFLAASIPEAASAAQTIKGSVSLKEGSVQPLRPVPNIFVELSGGGTSYRTLTNAEGQFIFDTTGIDHNCFEALINFEAVLKPIAAGPDIAVVSKTELDTRGPTKAFPLTGLKKEIRNTFIPLVVDPGVAPDTAQALETILAFRRTMAAAVKAARPYGTELVTAIESISRQKHILIPVGAGENPVIRFPSKPGETVLLTIPSSDSDGRTMALALANEAVHLLLAKHPLARKLPLQWVQVLPSRSPGGTQGDELRHELAALVCRMLSFNLPDIPSGLAPIFLAPSTTVTPEELFRLIRDRQIGSLKGLLSLLSKTTKPSVKRIAKQPVVSPEALEELEQLRQRLKELQARWEKAYSQITKGTMLFSQFMTEVGALESRLAGLAGPETVALARNITAPSLIEQWISRWNQKSPALKGRLKNSANKYIQEAASFYKDIDGKVRMVKESKRQSKAEVESMETRLGEIITGFFTGFNTLLEEIHTSKTNRWYSIWLNPSRHVSTLENRLLEALDLVDRIEQEFLETDAPGREKIPKRLGTLIQQINREIFHLKGKIVRTEMLASASDNTADHLHQIHKTYTSSATPLLKQYRALITTKGHLLETDPHLFFYRSDGTKKLYVESAVTTRAESLLEGMQRLNRTNLKGLLVNLQKAINRLERLKTRLIKYSPVPEQNTELDDDHRRPPHFANIKIHDRALEEYGGVILISRRELKKNKIHLSGKFNQGDYRFKKVQVSTDYGNTWNDASGLEQWSYRFDVADLQSYPLAIKVVDTSGKPFELEISPIEIYLEP